MKNRKWVILVGCILLPLLAGLIGSIATGTSVNTWYATLEKPFFNPPNWLFAPVWTLLYVMMGISFYLALTSKAKPKMAAALIFTLQLILNVLWSVLFFWLKCPPCALANILALWVAIIINIRLFRKLSRISALLLIPYLLWVSFATLLNLSIVLLN